MCSLVFAGAECKDSISRHGAGADQSACPAAGRARSAVRRQMHVNNWLVEEGFLVLKDGVKKSDSGGFACVDWSKTKAYAVGLVGIFLNIRGREAHGIVPPGEDANGKPHQMRLYSVASPRDGERPNTNNLALTVKREPGGLASNYLCDLPKGAEIDRTGPFGATFLMPNDPQANIIMICTGTGSAPFRAFTERLRYLNLLLAATELPPEQLLAAHIRQVYGARSSDDEWLARVAREVSGLFKSDYERLMTVLYGIEPQA